MTASRRKFSLRSLFIALFTALSAFLVSCGGGDSGGEYKKISPEKAMEMISAGGVIILDVRTPDEFAAGHIEGALLLPDYEITSRAGEVLPDKSAAILVYCRSGNRSATAAKRLLAMGYEAVYDFGGIIDWPYGLVR